jgi:hypothetical protein
MSPSDRLKAWTITLALSAVLVYGVTLGLVLFVFVALIVLMIAILIATKQKSKFPVLFILSLVCVCFVLLTQNCAVRILGHAYALASDGKWVELSPPVRSP